MSRLPRKRYRQPATLYRREIPIASSVIILLIVLQTRGDIHQVPYATAITFLNLGIFGLLVLGVLTIKAMLTPAPKEKSEPGKRRAK